MRASESELVSQEVDEQEARLDFSRVTGSIHSEGNGALHSLPSLRLLIGLRYQIFGLLVNPSNRSVEFGCNRRMRMSVCTEQKCDEKQRSGVGTQIVPGGRNSASAE
jgi:hypothetical protein